MSENTIKVTKPAPKPAPKPEVDSTKDESVDLGVFEFEFESARCQPSNARLGVFKLSDSAVTPFYATENSACFDFSVDYGGIGAVTVYDDANIATQRNVRGHSEVDNKLSIVLNPGDRAIIPTNLIFDIPEGYQVAIYPRSGVSLKDGINLANCAAVIDSDYVDPIYLLLHNFSNVRQFICQGTRVAQGELKKVTQCEFSTITERPAQKTSRVGGLGHTGKGG